MESIVTRRFYHMDHKNILKWPQKFLISKEKKPEIMEQLVLNSDMICETACYNPLSNFNFVRISG